MLHNQPLDVENLIEKCQEGDYVFVKNAVDQYGFCAVVSAKASVTGDLKGRTCLHASCFGRETDEDRKRIAYLLLEYGADPNVRDANGATPLMYVAHEMFDRKLDIVEALLAFGADVNLVDKDGVSAVWWAAVKENDYRKVRFKLSIVRRT